MSSVDKLDSSALIISGFPQALYLYFTLSTLYQSNIDYILPLPSRLFLVVMKLKKRVVYKFQIPSRNPHKNRQIPPSQNYIKVPFFSS